MFPFVRMTKNRTVSRHVKLNHIYVFFYLTSSDLRILVSVTYKMALSFRIFGTGTHTMFSRNYKYWVRHVQGRPRYFCARQSNLTRAYNACHFICIFKGIVSRHLTHFYLETCRRVMGKQCRPRSDVASDQGLHCLLTGFSIKNRIKKTK